MTENINKEQFLEKVFNYEESQEWNFDKELPVIIDFYANWCGPCKALAPILEQIGNDFEGKLNIYKVDTEVEQELSQAFGIRSLPTLIFCPIGEEAQIIHRSMSKIEILKFIDEVLKVDF